MDMTFWLPETEAALAQVKEGCSEGSVTRLHCETLRPTPSHKSCRTCLPTCPSVHIFPVFYAYCISRRNFLVASSCVCYGGHIEQRAAHEFAVHVAPQRRARETSTAPPSAARVARCARA